MRLKPVSEEEEKVILKDVHSWISNDVTIEQLNAVIWAMMMSNSDEDILMIIKQKRREYHREMNNTVRETDAEDSSIPIAKNS